MLVRTGDAAPRTQIGRSPLTKATWEGCNTAALEGYPDPPTGKCTSTNFVYKSTSTACMIDGLDKVWNDDWSLAELGWA